MQKVLREAIDIYAGLDSTDKSFLAELRHGRTRIEKAVKLRRLFLDNDADDKLVAGAAKLEPMFLARPEVRQAHKEIMDLQSTLPMNIDDFQDWYGFVIEFTCANCTRAGYTECPARRVLTKYEICPINPGAKDKCQYSYVYNAPAIEPSVQGVSEKQEFEELGSVPSQGTLEELQGKLDLVEKRFEFQTQECLGLLQQNINLQEQLDEYESFKLSVNNLLHPDGNGPKNPTMLYIFKHILNSWNNFTERISSLIAENTNLTNKNTIIINQNNKITCGYNEISKIIKRNIFPQIATESITGKHEKYRVDKYFATMYDDFPDGRNRAQCHVCREKVFVDNQADKVIDPADGMEAILATNLYFVSSNTRNKAV